MARNGQRDGSTALEAFSSEMGGLLVFLLITFSLSLAHMPRSGWRVRYRFESWRFIGSGGGTIASTLRTLGRGQGRACALGSTHVDVGENGWWMHNRHL